jgi:hypothetical protein
VNLTKVPLSCIASQPRSTQFHARAISAGLRVLEEERLVYQLDMDAAVLNRLDGAGDLDDAAPGFPRLSLFP